LILVKKLTAEDLESLEVAEGFTRWIESSSKDGKAELKKHLAERLSDGNEIWGALDGDILVGFAVIADWHSFPGGKAIDSMEVAESHRGSGVGSKISSKIIEEHDTIMAVIPFPEPGFEKKLENFYHKFGFKHVTGDVMIRIPNGRDKLNRWIKYLDRLLDLYDSLRKEFDERMAKE